MRLNSKMTVLCFLFVVACVVGHPGFAENAPVSMAPAAQETHGVTLWELLKAGGWAMLVLILLSVIATALIVYNFMTIKLELVAPQRFAEDLVQKLEARDDKSIRAMCASKSNMIAAITWEGYERRSKGRLVVREAMENCGRREVGRLWQNISYLGDIATIAPLLGLLGTTLGMIQAFNVISFAGANLKPIMLVGGISKALVTTAAGLIVAVPALSFYSYFRGKVQDISDQVERYSMDIMKLVEETATRNF